MSAGGELDLSVNPALAFRIGNIDQLMNPLGVTLIIAAVLGLLLRI
jgi:hypothetical protein